MVRKNNYLKYRYLKIVLKYSKEVSVGVKEATYIEREIPSLK